MFEKCFDLHQTIFEQRRTFPNMKFIIEKGGQTRRGCAEHESWTLFIEWFVAFGQNYEREVKGLTPRKNSRPYSTKPWKMFLCRIGRNFCSNGGVVELWNFNCMSKNWLPGAKFHSGVSRSSGHPAQWAAAPELRKNCKVQPISVEFKGVGTAAPKLSRNLFPSGKFAERTIGNSGRQFAAPPKFDVLLHPCNGS